MKNLRFIFLTHRIRIKRSMLQRDHKGNTIVMKIILLAVSMKMLNDNSNNGRNRNELQVKDRN